MPMHVTRLSRRRLTRRGLIGGALALTLLGVGGGALSPAALRLAQAEEVDCYDHDDAAYDSPECVQKREADAASNAPAPSSDSPPAPTEAPPAPSSNPKDVILKFEDAGKESFISDESEGSDKYGRWAHSRYERDRSDGASTLGPNVMDSKAWVAKDLDTAKALYKEQVAIDKFPERKEAITGPVEKVKPNLFGEESSYMARYYQDGDNKIWQHYRFVMRKATTVAVVYLYGKEAFFVDRKDKSLWSGQGDWFTQKVSERM